MEIHSQLLTNLIMTPEHASKRQEQVRLILGSIHSTKQFNRFSLLFTFYRNFGK